MDFLCTSGTFGVLPTVKVQGRERAGSSIALWAFLSVALPAPKEIWMPGDGTSRIRIVLEESTWRSYLGRGEGTAIGDGLES